jgi:hypothetical protein
MLPLWRLATVLAAVAGLWLCLPAEPGAGLTARAGRTCPVTIAPTNWRPTGPAFGPGRFNYGNTRIRAALYWPRGTLVAGELPDGGVMAVIERDGSISLKLGWWRGVAGTLVITGRRLDRPTGPLRGDVPPNESYGETGFIPSSVVFPSTGCWRVTGKQGGASLTFVVKVIKAKLPSISPAPS